MFRVTATLFSCFLLTSCLGGDERILTSATGKAGDLVIVMDSSFWNGSAGTAALHCFAGPQEGLPQPEPLFNVIRLTKPNFKQIFKTTRNILILEKQAANGEKKFATLHDHWAKDQLVLIIYAPDDASAGAILEKNCIHLANTFNHAERRRIYEAFGKLRNLDLVEKAQQVVGVSPRIVSDYHLVKSTKEYVWYRKDFEQKGHQVSMGLMFYKAPYLSEDDFDTDFLIALRNEMVKAVEGPSDTSYMTTYPALVPVESVEEINGFYVKTLRGLWTMKGAFMGGPFINQTFVNQAGTEMICVEGYVFAPGLDKREFLRELEVIAYSAIPSGK